MMEGPWCRFRREARARERHQHRAGGYSLKALDLDRPIREADIVPTTCEFSRDQSLVDARDRSFQSAPCFCQFIRIWRLVLLFLPSATAWLSPTQWKRTIAAVPTTRICGSRYSSDRNFDFPLVALAMKVALSSTRPSEWL